jgi:hypothetical protein
LKYNKFSKSFLSKRSDREYQIWYATNAIKNISSLIFFRQKLNYIHNNPKQENWLLVDNSEDYIYSSARDYLLGEKGLLPLEKLSLG